MLVLNHNSNFCKGDSDTFEYGAVFSNSPSGKFFVFSLETTIISKEDQIYAILIQGKFTLLFMVTPLCFATPNDIENCILKENDSLSSNFTLDRHSCKLQLTSFAVILIRDESAFATVIIRPK